MFLERCPALKHLVLTLPAARNSGVFSHKSLQWIDVRVLRVMSALNPDAVMCLLKSQGCPEL